MSASIRLFLGRGQKLDLRMQKVAERDCSVEIDAQPCGDYRVTIDFPVVGGGELVNAQREVDDVVQGSTASEDVGESDWHTVGIANQTGPDFNLLLNHHEYPVGQGFGPATVNVMPAGVQR